MLIIGLLVLTVALWLSVLCLIDRHETKARKKRAELWSRAVTRLEKKR